MTVKEICDYIDILDYIDYRIYIHNTFGDTTKRRLLCKRRYMRHKIHTLAIDMIARGDYYG